METHTKSMIVWRLACFLIYTEDYQLQEKDEIYELIEQSCVDKKYWIKLLEIENQVDEIFQNFELYGERHTRLRIIIENVII